MVTENERKKILSQIFKNVANKKWNCVFHGCDKPAINSHLLQRNGILNSVAEEGHLIEIKQTDVFKWQRDQSPLDFRRVGINDAFSLPLFCNHHDTTLFKEIESDGTDFTNYKAQLLLSYRVLSAELRKKEINAEKFTRILNAHSLQDSMDMAGIKMMLESNNLGIADLKKYRQLADEELANPQGVFVFSTVTFPLIKVYGSAIFSPVDYTIVNPRQEQPLNAVFVHVIPYKNHLHVVVGNHREFSDGWIGQYRESWKGLSGIDLERKITNLFAARIENWGLSPLIYRNISRRTLTEFLDYHRENVPNLSANQVTDFNLFEDQNYG